MPVLCGTPASSPDGEDGAFGVLCAALGQPQVDAALDVANGQRRAVRLDQHVIFGAVRGEEIGRLADHRRW